MFNHADAVITNTIINSHYRLSSMRTVWREYWISWFWFRNRKLVQMTQLWMMVQSKALCWT